MQSSAQKIAKLQTLLERIEKQNSRQKRLLIVLTLLLLPLFIMGAKHGANDPNLARSPQLGLPSTMRPV